MLLMFDNQCPPNLAKGLDQIEQGNKRSPLHADVRHIRDFLNQDATDEEIIECAGKNNAVIITFDKDFKHIKHYYQLYKQHKASVVFFKSGKHNSYWEMVRTFINFWEEMKTRINAERPPFALEISKKGITKLSF